MTAVFNIQHESAAALIQYNSGDTTKCFGPAEESVRRREESLTQKDLIKE